MTKENSAVPLLGKSPIRVENLSDRAANCSHSEQRKESSKPRALVEKTWGYLPGGKFGGGLMEHKLTAPNRDVQRP